MKFFRALDKCWYEEFRNSKVLTVQTLLFVAFNRVVTAQYFLWWQQFLPLWLPAVWRSSRIRRRLGAQQDSVTGKPPSQGQKNPASLEDLIEQLSLPGSPTRLLEAIIVWVFSVLLWLATAYVFEFHASKYWRNWDGEWGHLCCEGMRAAVFACSLVWFTASCKLATVLLDCKLVRGRESEA